MSLFLLNTSYLCFMLRAYKYRLYPTPAQAERINQNIGSCRFVYNLALETKNRAYASARVRLSVFDLIGQLKDLKKECEWLKEVDSQALQQSVIDLDKAFTSFFKGNNQFPKFKSKHKGNQAFRNPHGSRVEIIDGKLYQPKFTKEGIKIIVDRPHKGEIRSTTISRTPTGKYFVSVLCETGIEIPKKNPVNDNTAIGIDLGLSHFAITSDGSKVDNPRHLKGNIERLKVLQRRASRKQKGSNNRKKANKHVAILHERITNQRKDFLHKLSSKLISENQTLCFESLNVKGMIKNHKLAQSISDAGWGMFVSFCEYKAEWYGKNILKIPTFEPSTKLCSSCGTPNRTLTLKDREWTCANCGVHHDRDINAAKNIKQYCITKTPEGIRGEPVELPTLVGALKQEGLP
jgi:putative transposase